jgi:hypothetical protein
MESEGSLLYSQETATDKIIIWMIQCSLLPFISKATV